MRFTLTITLLLFTIVIFGQDFSKGWQAGFEDGYCDYNLQHQKMKPIFITPISPIAPIGFDTYNDGYRAGFIKGKKAFLKKCNDCENADEATPVNINSEGTFNDGWKDGYSDGYCEFNLTHNKLKPIFIIPITPIAPIGYTEYKDGYRLGFKKGKEDFDKKHPQ